MVNVMREIVSRVSWDFRSIGYIDGFKIAVFATFLFILSVFSLFRVKFWIENKGKNTNT